MTDFMIVGQGLAAHALMHSFHSHGISFHTIGRGDLSNCSRIAAGIWNPVVFKRLTKSWLADELIPQLHSFYRECENRLGTSLITLRPIVKPFTENQEKQLWLKKSVTELRRYLDETLYSEIPAAMQHCRITNGYGLVNQSGNLNVAAFLEAGNLYFKDFLSHEIFDHNELNILEDKVSYKGREAHNIIFCEGHLVSRNPFFSWIPLKPAKGEVLTLAIPGLRFSNLVFNRNGFLMDLGLGLYKAGATYEWEDLSDVATGKALGELTARVEQMIDCPYAIQSHEAGIRPSSLDRRPLIGAHPVHQRLFVFNGLGTKGVMLAPFFANNFVNFYLQKAELYPEVSLSRFYSLYETHQA